MRPRLSFLMAAMYRLGYRVTIYSGRRTLAEQRQRIRAGHSTVLRSKHLTGDAVDLIITPRHAIQRKAKDDRAPYRLAGKIWYAMGGLWGGDFRNPALAHAEYQHYERDEY